jgi:hypothetical protein
MRPDGVNRFKAQLLKHFALFTWRSDAIDTDGDGGVMSKFERLLVAGSTELPDCRCTAEMH